MAVLPQGEGFVGEVSTLFLPGTVNAPVPAGGPLPFGLMSVAQMIVGDGSRWHNGVVFQGTPCGRAFSTVDPCTAALEFDMTKTVTSAGLPARGAETFTVYADIECSPVGLWEDAQARAVAHLIAGEARAVEQVFWGGAVDSPSAVFIHPHLASTLTLFDGTGEISMQTAAEVLVTGVVDIVEGIGLLEKALGECSPTPGVIHAERTVMAHMAAWTQMERSGQRLQTIGGTPLAFGAGYTGVGPDGAPPEPGTTWLYATGAIMIRRDPDVTVTSDRSAALDRATNTLRVFAERSYNIAWDCCHFAVQVSLGGIITGTAGAAT